MLIGVISDTHIPQRAKMVPREALDAFQGVDLILHAGDLTTLDALEPLEAISRVIAVRGNMDAPEARSTLPKEKVLETNGARIGMTHGSGKPEDLHIRLRKHFEDRRLNVIVFGHSHEPFAEWVGDVFMFNPGSPTDDVYAKQRSVGLLRIDGDGVRGQIVPLP